MPKLRPGLQYIAKKEINLKGIKDIVLMGDTGCTGFDQEAKRVLSKILEKKADLFFILGDLVYGGTKKEFKEVIDFCNNKVNVPIFTLCGNHDLPDYRKVLGLTSYALVLDNRVIISLDNPAAPFSREDLLFLEDKLKKHKDKRFLVFFHIPPPNTLQNSGMKQDEWQSLKGVLDKHKERIECIFCAHIHGFLEYNLDGYRIFITGGGGAKLYDLEKDMLKSHHAIKLNLKNEDAVIFEVMPIIL